MNTSNECKCFDSRGFDICIISYDSYDVITSNSVRFNNNNRNKRRVLSRKIVRFKRNSILKLVTFDEIILAKYTKTKLDIFQPSHRVFI